MYLSRNTLGINCLFLRAKGIVIRYDSETLENGFFFKVVLGCKFGPYNGRVCLWKG